MAALFFLLLQLGLGWAGVPWIDVHRRWPSVARAAVAAVLGLTVSGYVALLVAVLTRSLFAGVLVAAVVAAAAAVWRWRLSPPAGGTIVAALTIGARQPWAWAVAVLAAVVAGLEIQVLLPAATFVRAVYVGWGDVAYHLGIIERFATAQPFTVGHPEFAGYPFTYPFVIDFLSAIYRRLGASTLVAYHVPVLVLMVAAVVLLFQWYRQVASRAGIAALMLLWALFGAGLGWLWLGADVGSTWQRGGISAAWETVRHPLHEYTHLDNRTSGLRPGTEGQANIVWMVPALSFLTHQRGFALGLTLGLTAVLAVATAGAAGPWAVGVLVGLLPLAHGHTLVAMAIIGAAWLVVGWPNRQTWLRIAVPAALVALPALLYIYAGLSGSSGTVVWRWWWGWMTCTHDRHWFTCDQPAWPGSDASVLWFWLKNFGGVFVAWAATLLWQGYRRLGRGQSVAAAGLPLALPTLLLFAVPNLVRLQPWEFDNNKVLFWWWIFAIGFIGQAIASLPRPRWQAWILGVLSAVILPAGVFDVVARLVSWDNYHAGYVDAADQAAADWISANTPANAVVAAGPTAGSLVPLLAGRPLALGYEGWLWSQGIDYAPRADALRALARGEIGPACAAGVRYAMADADFWQRFPGDPAALARAATRRWQQETPRGPRLIYELPCPP